MIRIVNSDGQWNTVMASSNETPCLVRFLRALSASHSKYTASDYHNTVLRCAEVKDVRARHGSDRGKNEGPHYERDQRPGLTAVDRPQMVA
jgi:hypothetical protein